MFPLSILPRNLCRIKGKRENQGGQQTRDTIRRSAKFRLFISRNGEKVNTSRSSYLLVIATFLLFSACSPQPAAMATLTLTPTLSAPSETITPAPTATATVEPSATSTSTQTAAPTSTYTPAPTETPLPTVTPTSEYPVLKVKMQANCRYGPGTAYLYSHGLYPGEQLEAHGRNYNGNWLWVQPRNLNRHCWAAKSVFENADDTGTLNFVTMKLPFSTDYPPPSNIQAVRSGDSVTVTWDRINFRGDHDRGYLIEANVCQNSSLVFMAVQTNDPTYIFTDETTCSQKSNALLYTAGKHGYSTPDIIVWP
jgi:hypothetical protein